MQTNSGFDAIIYAYRKEIHMTFAEKLYQLRKQKGLSQEQLADELGVSRQAISKWEGGACLPETEKLAQLSDFLGVSIDYLLKDNTDAVSPVENMPTTKTKANTSKILSIAFFCASAVCIAMLAVCFILNENGFGFNGAINGVDGSSVIVFNEKAIFITLANIFCALGIVFLVKYFLRRK